MKPIRAVGGSLEVMISSAVAPDHAFEAFEAFAPYYDAFTAHHDYEAWAAGLLGLAETHGLRGRRLLDVACGTGKSLLPFLERGFTVTACDQSPAMLAQAALKTRDRVHLYLVDARALPPLGRFDLITALCDVVNYMLAPDELVALFRGIAVNLAPEGLALFDANTLWTYANLWVNEAPAAAGDTDITWECIAGPDLPCGGLASARVHLSTGGEHRTSLLYERHHSAPTIERALQAAGLEAAAVLGQFPDGRMETTHDETRNSKTLYVARLRSLDRWERR